MLVGDAVRQTWQTAERELGAASDYTEIVRVLEAQTGVVIRPPTTQLLVGQGFSAVPTFAKQKWLDVFRI